MLDGLFNSIFNKNDVKSHWTWKKKQPQDHLQRTQLRRVKEKQKQKKYLFTKKNEKKKEQEQTYQRIWSLRLSLSGDGWRRLL